MNNIIKRVKKDLIIYSFFIFIAIIFWHPILFLGKFPWINDLSRQYYPWYLQLFKHLRSFTLPFWIPKMGAGYPLLAQGEVGVFYPINWLLIFLFSTSFGFKLYFPIHSVISSVGLYLFARKLKISKTASTFSALVFTYSFFFTVRSIHPPIIAAASYLPFGLIIIEHMFQSKAVKKGLLLSIIIALQLLAGHPQITYISLVAYVMYFVLRIIFFRIKKISMLIKQGIVFSTSILLGFGISLVQVLPTIELASYSSRMIEGTDFIFSYSLPKSHFLTLIFPYFFGISAANSNIGFWQFGGHYWEFAFYIGIFPFVLAAIGTFSFWKNSYSKILLVLFFIFSLLSIGGYLAPYRFIVRTFHLPFRVSARFLLPVTLSLSVLSGFGFDVLFQRTLLKKKYKVFLLTVISLIGFILFATFNSVFQRFTWVVSVQNIIQKLSQKLIFTEFQKVSLYNFSLRNIHISLSVIFIIISVTFIFLWRKKIFSRMFFVIFSFSLLFIDPYLQGFLYQQLVSQKEILSPPIFLSQFTKKPIRIMTMTQPSSIPIEKYTLQPNINLVWEIDSFNAVTPLPLKNHDKLYTHIKNNPKLMSDFGVSHVISQDLLSASNLTLLNNNTHSYVYENNEVFKKAFIVYDYSIVKSDEELLDLLFNKSKDLQKTVILQKDPSIEKVESDQIGETVTQIYDSIQKSVFTVTTQHDGIFIFLDSYYPSWKAFVDGVETEIYVANGFFRAVSVPSGNHEIVFRYVPTMFYIGLNFSVASIVILFVLLGKGHKKTI